jgi:hypothetical protein
MLKEELSGRWKLATVCEITGSVLLELGTVLQPTAMKTDTVTTTTNTLFIKTPFL